MSTANRSVNAPRAYQGQPEGRVNLYNQTYIGFVKDISDSTSMGRLKVWIPEISPGIASGSEDDSNKDGWITVSYCSPFAGATPVSQNKKDGTEAADSQQSYGWWAVPPHVGNEVVCQFINGDPNRGIWIGCLFQQRMNHMVPALANGTSSQEGEDGVPPPTVEYNKRDSEQAKNDDPQRPRFEPLHQGLVNQGLYSDNQRGPANTSARRETSSSTEGGGAGSTTSASHAYGFITPRGNTIHVDDDPQNEFIRLRTRSGAQVLINETVGYIYMISKNGNSWFEISDEGINAFTTRTFNVRAMQGTNLHSEGNTTINSVGSTNMTGSSGAFQVSGDLDIVVPGSFRVTAAGSINLKANGALNLQSEGNLSVLSGGTLAAQSNGALGVTASGQLFLNGSKINSNGGAGPSANEAEEATAPKPSDLDDREVNSSAGYPETTTSSIVGVLPTHEPWDGHPHSETPPDEIEMSSASTSVSVDGEEGADGGAENTDETDENFPPSDGKGWMMPVTGSVTSLYGPRKAPGGSSNHKGVDIGGNNRGSVYATKAGTVQTGYRPGRGGKAGNGKYIFITHAGGYLSQYLHLSEVLVKNGEKVEQGQLIGKVGNTGAAPGRRMGAHLHFGIKKGGSYINPQRIFPELNRKTNSVQARKKYPDK